MDWLMLSALHTDHNWSRKLGLLLVPFYRQANGGSERLNGLPRVTQPQFVTLSVFSNSAQNCYLGSPVSLFGTWSL